MNNHSTLQHNIAAFLDISIEHSMDIYLEQASKKPDPKDEIEKYLSRLKTCLGQVEILLKLGFTCSKNNIFDFCGNQIQPENPDHIHLMKAIEDLHQKNIKHIEEPELEKELDHDPDHTTTTSH